MNIKRITEKEWMPIVTQYIQSGSHGILYGVLDSKFAIVHRAYQVEENTCKELGYEIVESFNNGGTIVADNGDMLIGHFAEPSNGWYYNFISYFVNWLKDRGLNAEFLTNDIVVDGYKVCGMCITRYGNIDYTGGIISMNANLDHIKAICKKPMKKVPKGLSEYGITTEEVEQMFLEFCEVM